MTPGGVDRIAYVQCSAGVAGDMLLGALVDAGADPDVVAGVLSDLGLDGYAVTFERVQRGGISAMWANVVVLGTHGHDDHDHDGDGHDHEHAHGHAHDPGHEHPHRPAKVIREILDASELDPAIRSTAQSIFDTLAIAEGAVHGVDPDAIEFHEVGALDAIIDVVGVAAALHSLGVTRLVASPVAVGRGIVTAAHGQLPNPAPAVARLLAQRGMPTFGIDTGMELATPTGVAVLAALCEGFGAMPAMHVEAVGYGAGTADPPGRPNVVQVLVGRATETESSLTGPGRAAVLLESNVDDVTGEVIAHTITRLLGAGAFDAWAAPIVMKKGRPAYIVSALCDPSTRDVVGATLLAETGSLGVRASVVQRWPQSRVNTSVSIDGHRIAVKVAAGRVKVEHDDALAAAEALGRPLRDVLREAEQRASEIGPGEAHPTP